MSNGPEWFTAGFMKLETVERFADALCLLYPKTPKEQHMRAIDYTYWAIFGGKWDGDPKDLAVRYPDPVAFVAPQMAARSDVPRAILEWAHLREFVPAEALPAIDSFFAAALEACERIKDDVLVPRIVLQRAMADKITALAAGDGLDEAVLQRFQPAIEASVYLHQHTLSLQVAFPVLSIYLPLMKEDSGSFFARHPQLFAGTAIFYAACRIIALLKESTMTKDAAPGFTGHVMQWVESLASVGAEAASAPAPVVERPLVVPLPEQVRAVVDAVLRSGPPADGGGWTADSDGRPSYEYLGRDGGRIVVRIAPTRDAESPDAAWRLVDGFGTLSVDVALVAFARLLRESGSTTDDALRRPVVLTEADILDDKGVLPGSRASWNGRIAPEIKRLAALRFELATHASDGGESTTVPFVEVVPLATRTNGERSVAAWEIKAGPWADGWLHEGRAAQEHSPVAIIPSSLARFDHRTNRGAAAMAKKLGYALRCRVSPKAGATVIRYRVERLLERIGELPPEDLRSRNWAGRTRDRFDNALLLLHESGAAGHIGWPDGHDPGDVNRARGWVERWLSSTVVVTLPDSMLEHGVDVDNGRNGRSGRSERSGRSGRRRSDAHGTAAEWAGESHKAGPRLARIRQQSGMTQKTVARHLGVSRSYLGQIERGERTPSDEMVERMTTFLEAPKPS